MARSVVYREEMMTAVLNLGGAPLELADYATTGLLGLAIAPRGAGKSNAGILIAEQLAEQGWVSVLVDPEDELASMYGDPVGGPAELAGLLEARTKPIIVVAAKSAYEFADYGKVILDSADKYRKPLYVFIDEGQLFSASKKREEGVGEASDIIGEFAERGRKRALDLFITAHRYTGTVHRTLFSNKNLTLVGCQEDPTAWSNLAQQFRGTGIGYRDLNALAPAEFICFSRRGVEKIKMPMAEALKKVAPKARSVKHALPATFSQWDRAMRAIPKERLEALTDPVVQLLGNVAGLNAQQMLAGARALSDELETRP